MHHWLVDLFYIVSQSLLTPVMLALVLCMLLVMLMMGQAVREGLERWTLGRRWRAFIQRLRQDKAVSAEWRQAARVGLPVWFCDQARDTNAMRLLLPEGESRASRQLGRLQILIRVGPMLGLIGTLIPLGPALQGLSSSNLSLVGEHLNVSFTTTVFGIAVGAAAYCLYIVHRAWHERDLDDLEYLIVRLEQSETCLREEG